MLHEALLMLWHPTDSTFKNEDEWLLSMHQFLHPGECKQLEKVAHIAWDYHKILSFQRRFLDEPEESQIQLKHGYYLKALCRGFDDVLVDYRNTIIQLEATLLKNPKLNLSYVVYSIDQFNIIFNVLKSIIKTVEVEGVHGCLLMGRLQTYMNSGIPQVVKSANIIIQSINSIFYRHLANWLIFGEVTDEFKEFFIADCECDDESFLYPDQLVKTDERAVCPLQGRSKTRKPPPVRKFVIVPQMLPATLPQETAENILFVGRMVWIVRNEPRSTVNSTEARAGGGDVWSGRSLEHYKRIADLRTTTNGLHRIERTVADLQGDLSKYTWDIIMNEADLLEHLQILRDYYALGRGELFQQFIVAAEDQLKQQTTNLSSSFNFLFNETARKIYSENDKSYTRFELVIPKGSEAKNLTFLSNLEIHFEIKWPLHIIFHPKVISLYNKLFSFLLRLKKTHIDLHRLWLNQMVGKGKIDFRVWRLRHNLMFIVNNLQYYLQVDVIETYFSQLKTQLKSVNKISDIIRLHSSCLGHLLTKTFIMPMYKESERKEQNGLYQVPTLDYISKNTVYDLILLLLKLCEDFCVSATHWTAKLTDFERETVEDFSTRSNTMIESLMQALFSMHGQVAGQHLLKLLHRLDFNKWFTKSKPDFNVSLL